MTPEERFTANSAGLDAALRDVLTKLQSNPTDQLKADNEALKTQVTQLQASLDQQQALRDELLNRVSSWAEGMIANIRQIVPATQG